MKVDSHVSPYRRIEIGARTPDPVIIGIESEFAKSVRLADEEKRRVEYLRIWNHLVQIAGAGAAARDIRS